MSEDKLDFLDTQSAEVSAPEPVIETLADKGETPVMPEAAPPAEVDTKQHVAPLTALLDEREKRQEAERKFRDLERREQEREARSAQQQMPDFSNDPIAAMDYQRQVFQQRLYNERLNTSRFFAEQQHGADKVKEAFEFFDRNPALSHQFVDHPSPFHAAVEFYTKQKLADEVGSNPDAYRAKIREELRAEMLAEMQVPAQPKPRIPGSLAAAPAAGVQGEPRAKGSNFDNAFG